MNLNEGEMVTEIFKCGEGMGKIKFSLVQFSKMCDC